MHRISWVVLSVSFEPDNLKILRRQFVVSADEEYLPLEENANALVDTAAWLHSAIMPTSFMPEPEDDNFLPSIRNPSALLKHKVEEEERLLFHFLLRWQLAR